jgi:hypothetical protein
MTMVNFPRIGIVQHYSVGPIALISQVSSQDSLGIAAQKGFCGEISGQKCILPSVAHLLISVLSGIVNLHEG